MTIWLEWGKVTGKKAFVVMQPLEVGSIHRSGRLTRKPQRWESSQDRKSMTLDIDVIEMKLLKVKSSRRSRSDSIRDVKSLGTWCKRSRDGLQSERIWPASQRAELGQLDQFCRLIILYYSPTVSRDRAVRDRYGLLCLVWSRRWRVVVSSVIVET